MAAWPGNWSAGAWTPSLTRAPLRPCQSLLAYVALGLLCSALLGTGWKIKA